MSRMSGLIDDAAIGDPDEGDSFDSRTMDGRLIRLDAPTQADYEAQLTLHIDGQSVVVPRAEPYRDEQGNIHVDIEGRTMPRYTTIYDAAAALFRGTGESQNPIPVLCHQSHMSPVAVCRVCSVLVAKVEERMERRADGTEVQSKRLKLERRLTPACQRRAQDGMHVFTMSARYLDGYVAERHVVEWAAAAVRRSVGTTAEMMAARHLKPAPAPAPAEDLAPFNQLGRVVERLGISNSRMKHWAFSTPANDAGHGASPVAHRILDSSSPVFCVDHSACISCGVCSRACNDLKGNNVIGRIGKGRTSGIGFDLDVPMGNSSCVQCGECMISVPTSAITFARIARPPINLVPTQVRRDYPQSSVINLLVLGNKRRRPPLSDNGELVRATELLRDPLFASVPPKLLLWQEGLVLRRRVVKGEVLCRQGEPGKSAFLLKSGRFQIVVWDRDGKNRLNRVIRGVEALVLGETACLSGTPNTADIIVDEDGEVLEVRKNVLERVIRSPISRDIFQKIYRECALKGALMNSELFHGLPPEQFAGCDEFLQDRLTFLRLEPGQVMFRQGQWADALYLIRLGHVRAAIALPGEEETVVLRGPGSILGELGLVALSLPEPETVAEARQLIESLDRQMFEALNVPFGQLSAAVPSGRRSTTCSALDHVELVRLSREDFLRMIRQFPAIRRRLIEISVSRLAEERGAGTGARNDIREYVRQGLYQAQNLLAIDLNTCTRCDECVRACVDHHGFESHGAPLTRLIRDGERFGNYLVATSCRSCKDAYCLMSCPVDAIHRGGHGEIVIEDHCIGCGLCANNCPYGNIWMAPDENRYDEVPEAGSPGNSKWIAKLKAVTCDLCATDDPRGELAPRCVHACPHDSAHRMSGEELRRLVTRQ